jgi:hypothetical protein
MPKKLKSEPQLLKEISDKLDKILVAISISNKNENDQIKILKKFKKKWSLREIEKWSGLDRHKFSKKTMKKIDKK